MKRIHVARGAALRAAGVSLLLMNISWAAEPESLPQLTALHCGHVIDTAAGKTLGATTLVIEGSRVRDIQAGTAAPAGAKEIDLSTQGDSARRGGRRRFDRTWHLSRRRGHAGG